ncbi:MAG TPA: hypothetical protein VK749_15930 [Xanthobacteraceae bacterium]|jgi:hypothetical protein|nr:hypothetical protein [Xanthobacteraceae bacterium]
MTAADMPEPGTEAHRAWLDSLTGDDLLIIHLPPGYQWMLVLASLEKRLLQGDMEPGLRLRLLESLNSMIHGLITADMLAMIQPMCDTAYQIWKEAKTLDREGDQACMASFRVITSWRVFNHFLKLNPSILDAIRLEDQQRGAAASRVPRGQAKPTDTYTRI